MDTKLIARVKDVMKHYELNVSQFAEATGISQANMSSMLNGKRVIGEGVLNKISISFDNIDRDWLISGTGKMLRSKVSETSKRIDQIIKNENISPEVFFESIGIEKKMYLYFYKSFASPDINILANIIEKYPQYSLKWLLNGEGDMFSANKNPEETRPRIPLNAVAGSVSIALSGVSNDDCEQLPFVSAFSNYNYTILVKGDSMEPEFKSGDELACLQLSNGKSKFIQWGRYHVLDTAQGIIVKRIYDDGDYILCRSENKDIYPDFQIPKEDIYNIGLVIGMLRRY